ncbi:MAG: cytochrome b N-terminal domain-containing protein [bacterium]|nr:cytochrome b N-terminal domain-containing protein [bacterium]
MLTIQKIKSELQQTGTVLGGLLMVLLLLLIVSGIVLSLFYSAQPEETYQSMITIMGNPITAFVRNFHAWASDIFLFTLFLHMTRVALTKPSGKARRYAWWIGVGMLIMVSAEMLIGTFMRGDQEALEAYSHFFIGTTGIVASYMPYTEFVTDFFSQHNALFRFFVLHAVLLPFGIISLIVLHGLFAPTFRALIAPWKKVTDAAIRGQLAPQPGFFSSPSVRKILWLVGVACVAIVALSILLPAPLLSSPYAGLEVTKPPWWLLWVVAIENVWGLTPIVIAPPVLFLIFILIPLFTKDRAGADWGVYIYLIAIAIVISLSFWATLAPQVAHTEHFIEQQEQVAH